MAIKSKIMRLGACSVWILTSVAVLRLVRVPSSFRFNETNEELPTASSKNYEDNSSFLDESLSNSTIISSPLPVSGVASTLSKSLDTAPRSIKVPFPVFVASLYKSGTTSVHAYFRCGGQPSTHKWGPKGRNIGVCTKDNIANGRPAFFGCARWGEQSVFTDNSSGCWDPSIYGLQGIYESYPNATILLSTRDSHSWIDSVERFRFPRWALLEMLIECDKDLWPGKTDLLGDSVLSKEDIRKFYLWHAQHVRDFAAEHPSMTFVEFDIESQDAGAFLQDAIGITAECWGQKNKNEKLPGR